MNLKKYKNLMMLVMALFTTLPVVAQTTLQQGTQITTEASVVSGRPYLF